MTNSPDQHMPAPIRHHVPTALMLLGVLLILGGYFSPWVPHRAAGLALTGFEISEWIKFAPEVQTGAAPLRRASFYWPPFVAALGLALLATREPRWGWRAWLLVALSTVLSLLPFPLLEEVGDLAGIRNNLGRLALVAAGLATAALAVWRRHLPDRLRGTVMLLVGAGGTVLVTTAFSAAEPIVERLFNHLIDPGVGYHLTRGGMLLLALAGLVDLVSFTRQGNGCQSRVP
jgi:hypothetical protein